MKTLTLLMAAGALLLWLNPGPAGAGFPFMEPRTYGSMDVPSIFSLFHKPAAESCVDVGKSETLYAYTAWPFSGNTAESDKNAENPRDENCEKETCCSGDEKEKNPDTSGEKDDNKTG